MNYGIKKNDGLRDELWIFEQKNDGYSVMIYKIIINSGIEKNIDFQTNYGFAKKK